MHLNIASRTDIPFSWLPNGFAGIFFCLLEMFTCVCVSPLPYRLFLFRLIDWPFFVFLYFGFCLCARWAALAIVCVSVCLILFSYHRHQKCPHKALSAKHQGWTIFKSDKTTGCRSMVAQFETVCIWLWPNGISVAWHSLWWTIMWLVPLRSRIRFGSYNLMRWRVLLVEIFIKYRWE